MQGQDKLVPAPAGEPIALSDVAPDDASHVAYANVPSLVAVGVVYGLEVVHVNHGNRKRAPAAFHSRNVLRQALFALAAIVEAGEVIGPGEPFERVDGRV
jgi:hypothetical protein